MTSIPLADAKAHLSEVVSRVSKHHERVTVTVHGQPSAVLVAPDDLAMLEETIAVLADRDLPDAVATAAFTFITGPLLENPHRVGKRLRPPLADRHSARRGTYRILYRIDDQARTVTVLAIGHRGDIYRA